MDVATIGSADVLRFVRGMIGVKYHLGGRSRKSGLDCAGLVISVMDRFDLPKPINPNSYNRANHYGFVVDQLNRCMDRVPLNRAKPGMVVVMKYDGFSFVHVAIIDSALQIIEADNSPRHMKVKRSSLNRSRFRAVYAYRGVSY